MNYLNLKDWANPSMKWLRFIQKPELENKLERIELSEIQTQGKLALVKNSLHSGDKIITSDLFPAVPGMDLTPMDDQVSQQQMAQWLKASQVAGE